MIIIVIIIIFITEGHDLRLPRRRPRQAALLLQRALAERGPRRGGYPLTGQAGLMLS